MTGRFLALNALFFGLLVVIAIPLGRYLARVFVGEARTAARVLGPVERVLYRAAGVDPAEEHDWKQYATAVLVFSLGTQLFTYALLRLQGGLPMNPGKLSAVAPWLAFNTATSFTTNTNWQSYSGEVTMSYLSQAVALTSHNFFSAAVGICVAIVVIRGLARAETQRLGNFWVDVVRVHLYVLLPISILYAVFLVSQGVIQTLDGSVVFHALDGTSQTLARGPVASQEAIKMFGTNGGGYFNANSSHPWENPTPLTNFVQMLSIFAIPGALCFTLGEMVKNRRHGPAIFVSMAIIAIAGSLVIGHFEQAGNPLLLDKGMSLALGNMEGKEVRFGVPDTSLFAEVTTAASCGAVNGMHDSFMPLAGLVPLLNIQLGEIVFGGVGSGLYGALVYVVIAVFLAGLMVGRTPEYLGKKIDSRDIRFASLFVLIPAFSILLFTALGSMTEAGRAGISNTAAADVAGTTWKPHPHGLAEILYAFSSATGNNGSAFAGLTAFSSDHPVFYSLTLAIAMFVGRFFPMIAVLAMAGNLARKKLVPVGPGTFPVDGALFVGLFVAVILVVGALTFFPALSLSPIAEHLLLK